MLIPVGVVLDTMRQVETYLLQRHYDGFLKKGRIRARSAAPSGASGEALSSEALVKLGVPVTLIFLVGIVSWAIQRFAL